MHHALSDLWDGFWGVYSVSSKYVNVYINNGPGPSFLLGSYLWATILFNMLYRFYCRGRSRGKTFFEWVKLWIETKSDNNPVVRCLIVLYVMIVGLGFTYFAIYRPALDTSIYFNSKEKIVETRSGKLSYFQISIGGYRIKKATVNALLTLDNGEVFVVHFVDASRTFAREIKEDSYDVEVGLTSANQPLSITDGFYE